MPSETPDAIAWALREPNITADTTHDLVDAVRQWFNEHGVVYPTFSFADLAPYL